MGQGHQGGLLLGSGIGSRAGQGDIRYRVPQPHETLFQPGIPGGHLGVAEVEVRVDVLNGYTSGTQVVG